MIKQLRAQHRKMSREAERIEIKSMDYGLRKELAWLSTCKICIPSEVLICSSIKEG